MKKLPALFTALAVIILSLGAFFATAPKVHATEEDKAAIGHIRTTMETFQSSTEDATGLADDTEFYMSVESSAQIAVLQLAQDRSNLQNTTETGGSAAALHDMARIVNRLVNQLVLLQQNAQRQDEEGYNNTLDGVYDTTYEFDIAASNYELNYVDSSDEVDAAIGFYTLAGWIALCILVGTIVWAFQDKALENTKPLRRARLYIMLGSCLVLAGIIAMAIVQAVTDSFPWALLVFTAALAIATLVLRAKYATTARKARPAATVADNVQLQTSTARFVWYNIFTGGLYSTYWAWKAWQIVGKAEGKQYNNTVRAFFLAFTNFTLFKKIDEVARAAGYTKKINHQALAAGYLFVYIVGNILSRSDDDAWTVSAVSLLVTAISIIVFLPIVRAHNYSVGAAKQPLFPLKNPTAIFTAIGVAFAILILFGLYLIGTSTSS
jgi:hypothetical protein